MLIGLFKLYYIGMIRSWWEAEAKLHSRRLARGSWATIFFFIIFNGSLQKIIRRRLEARRNRLILELRHYQHSGYYILWLFLNKIYTKLKIFVALKYRISKFNIFLGKKTSTLFAFIFFRNYFDSYLW